MRVRMDEVVGELNHELPKSSFVSVIIPLHRDTAIFRKSLALLSVIDYDAYEVIVVSDIDIVALPNWVIHVQTGSKTDTGPGVKRDIGLRAAKGVIIAYIDDDAYPRTDWLREATAYLNRNPSISAIGGPGLTPPDSSFRERLSGCIYESRLGSGPLRFRFVQRGLEGSLVDDWPAYNLLIRRIALEEVGGWSTSLYGGEDTWLCSRLIDAGCKIAYSPNVVVFHHRRRVVIPHLKQVSNIGRRRGSFTRSRLNTSKRVVYFVPLIVIALISVISIAGLIEFLFVPGVRVLVLATILISWLVVSAERFRELGLGSLAIPPLLIMHHFSYGCSFLVGWILNDSIPFKVNS